MSNIYELVNKLQQYQKTGRQPDLAGKYRIPEVKGRIENVHAYAKGKVFDNWIDSVAGVARSNGWNGGDLITNPVYIIEDILRSEVFSERQLTKTSYSSTTVFQASGVKSSENDFYKYALMYNVSTDHKVNVNSFTGNTKSFGTDSDAGSAAGDKIYFTNIQGHNRIDYASFDKVGNTTNGLRNGWVFGHSIHERRLVSDILNEILFESHCLLFLSNKKYKLIALDAESGSVDTWTTPLYQNGRELAAVGFTSLQNLYSSFRIKYAYDHGSGKYLKEWYVGKNTYTSGGASLGATEQALCAGVETNYKQSRKYEYSCNWIYDDATAEKFTIKLVNWLTKQRAIVSWSGSVKDYIKYEIGDQLLINNSRLLPTGINNTSKFMITNKVIVPIPGAPQVRFTLTEMS